MKRRIMLGMAATLLCVASGLAVAADKSTETRTVDASVERVKLEGAADLKIRHGARAALVVTGDKNLVVRTLTTQQGQTLSIDTQGPHRIRFGSTPKVTVELVLPRLRAVTVEAYGNTSVDGFDGDEIDIQLDGAGHMQLSSKYRKVRANLGGIGNLVMNKVDSESVELELGGAGHVTMNGRSTTMNVELGGLGGLDARQCQVDTLTLSLSGLGSARVHARNSADLSLSGMGSVVVFGKPSNRKVSVDGLGSVSWR